MTAGSQLRTRFCCAIDNDKLVAKQQLLAACHRLRTVVHQLVLGRGGRAAPEAPEPLRGEAFSAAMGGPIRAVVGGEIWGVG